MLQSIQSWAKSLKKHIFILYYAYRDVSWYAKLFTACVVAYAFRPSNLFPDSIKSRLDRHWI